MKNTAQLLADQVSFADFVESAPPGVIPPRSTPYNILAARFMESPRARAVSDGARLLLWDLLCHPALPRLPGTGFLKAPVCPPEGKDGQLVRRRGVTYLVDIQSKTERTIRRRLGELVGAGLIRREENTALTEIMYRDVIGLNPRVTRITPELAGKLASFFSGLRMNELASRAFNEIRNLLHVFKGMWQVFSGKLMALWKGSREATLARYIGLLHVGKVLPCSTSSRKTEKPSIQRARMWKGAQVFDPPGPEPLKARSQRQENPPVQQALDFGREVGRAERRMYLADCFAAIGRRLQAAR